MSNPSRAAVDDMLLVLPFYLVIDVSQSMRANGGLDAANKMFPEIIDAIVESPTVCDVVRFGAMDFADDARVVLRLGDIRDIDTLPRLTARGAATSYASTFRLLRSEIENDWVQLNSDDLRMYRPAVFIVTDGLPNDDDETLRAAFTELTEASFRHRPNIVLFGVAEATKEALDPWVFPKPGQSEKPMRSYVIRPGITPAVALAQVAEALISSVMSSVRSVSTLGESGGFVPPDEEDLDDWI
jgi:uncharacterized protein YegL